MDRIKIGRKLGEGGMGKVFLATYVVDPLTKKTITAAVKKVVPSKMNMDEIVLQAQLSRLPHCEKHIACFYDIFTDPRTNDYEIVMEYIKGKEMWDYVTQHKGPFSDAELRNIMRQALEGMAFIHSHDIAHADIKLENFMFADNGQVKFIDFGFGCNVQSCATALVWHGTRFLAPPEAIARSRPKNLAAMQRADLWALGAMFIEIAAYNGTLRRVDQLGLNGVKMRKKATLPPSKHAALRKRSPDILKVLDGLTNPKPLQRINATDALKLLKSQKK